MTQEKDKEKALRLKIDDILKTRKIDSDFINSKSMDEILQEMSIYHQEVEYQNEELRRIQQELERSRHHYYNLFEQAPQGYIIYDKYNNIVECNKAFCAMVGIDRKNLKNSSIIPFIQPESQDDFYFHCRQLLKGNKMPINVELVLKGKKDNIFVKMESNIFNENNKKLIRSAVIDITDEKNMENSIKKSLKEKETLLKEIHHRVKNNLQSISSLLSLQASMIKDDRLYEEFREAQNRVKTMAMIHEKMYRSSSLDSIELNEHIRDLVDNLISTYNVNGQNIETVFDIDNIYLNIEQGIPFGLILNELVSNSIKHGFDRMENGKIIIKANRIDDIIRFSIKDNGKGLLNDRDIDKNDTLGWQLINILTQELEGTIDIYNKDGLEIVISFPYQKI